MPRRRVAGTSLAKRLRAAVSTACSKHGLKPVLNWANVCSPNIFRTLRRTMVRFLIEVFSSPNMVRTVQTLLRSQMACNEMQASARTCGRRAADIMIENVGSSQVSRVKSIYFHHPSQGSSTNYCLILGLRDKAAPPTSQQINSLRSE